MTDSRNRPDPAASGTRPTWVVVGVLLAVGAVVPLFVGLYDSESPRLGSWPFFFWFQFLLIPVVSGMTFVAFKLSETATERDRAARGVRRRKP